MSNSVKRQATALGWCVWAALWGVAGLVLLLLAGAFLLARGYVPSGSLNGVAHGALFAASAAAGRVAAVKRGRGVLAAGACVGAVLALLISLAAALSPEGSALCVHNLKLCLCAVAGGALGGITRQKGGAEKNRRKKRKNRS